MSNSMSTSTNIENHLKQIEQRAMYILEHTDDITNTSAVSMRKLKESISAIRQELTAQAKSTKHEGWSNYETLMYWKWLMFDDKSDEIDFINRLIKTQDLNDMSLSIKKYIWGIAPMRTDIDTLFKDFITTSMRRINFTEIAERFIAEAKGDGINDSASNELDAEAREQEE